MQAGDRIHDRYVLDSRLGEGGMSQVWCAHDERLDRDVAVKFLSERLAEDPENLVRFFSEAQQIARIQHKHVITVLDFGDIDGCPYIVMEQLIGGSLADIAGERIDPELALGYVAAAAAGAGAAHELGIVHRDIKPGNILLDDVGQVRLADFGIAAYEGAEKMTQTGVAIGSPHYISPEQAQGEPATPASDVYALGIVFYQLVTGRRPFENENVTAVLLGHVERPPVTPSTWVEDLDGAIEVVIMRCLAKDPHERYADGTALAAALEDITARGGDSTTPVPLVAGATAVVERPARRKRTAALIAAAILTVGVATTAAVMSGSSSEGGDVAIAETPSPTPTKSGKGDKRPGGDQTASPSASPTPSVSATAPVAADDDAGTDTGEEDGGGDDKPKPKPTPTPTPTPTASPSPAPTTAP